MGKAPRQRAMAEIADREAKEVRLGLIFDKMDDDGDGKLSKDELAKYLGAENADECLADCDVDNDGNVDKPEFYKCILEKFPIADFDQGCEFLENQTTEVQAEKAAQ